MNDFHTDASVKSGGGESVNSKSSIPLSSGLDQRKNVNLSPKPLEELPPEIQKIISERGKGKKESVLSFLEGKYVLSLILYLDKMSPVVKSDIYNDIARSSGMSKKIDDLYRLGIVEIYLTAHTNTNVVVITDKGREVAALIRNIFNIIETE